MSDGRSSKIQTLAGSESDTSRRGFCQVRYGGQAVSTKAQTNTTSPAFNESLTLYAPTSSDALLTPKLTPKRRVPSSPRHPRVPNARFALRRTNLRTTRAGRQAFARLAPLERSRLHPPPARVGNPPARVRPRDREWAAGDRENERRERAPRDRERVPRA
eukprot:941873-Prorocentrum_minimum.AAC.3